MRCEVRVKAQGRDRWGYEEAGERVSGQVGSTAGRRLAALLCLLLALLLTTRRL